MKTVLDFRKMKLEKQKISMVTCYDFWTAKILNQSPVDCLLVGDSLAMVMHGFSSTLLATVEMMALHTAAVSRGASQKFIVSDMPFLSFRKGLASAMEAAEKLMQAGAAALKVEGVLGHEKVVENIVQSGIPVMGHLGLTPQSVHQLGGFKVQGRESKVAMAIREQAKVLQDLGCFSLVLECIPTSLATEISYGLEIPTIGIGAGPTTDGQVLVLQDMLGAQKDFHPQFLRTFGNTYDEIDQAIKRFDRDVKEGRFPSIAETYQ